MHDYQCCCAYCVFEAWCDEANDDNVCPYSYPAATGAVNEDQKLD